MDIMCGMHPVAKDWFLNLNFDMELRVPFSLFLEEPSRSVGAAEVWLQNDSSEYCQKEASELLGSMIGTTDMMCSFIAVTI